MNNANIGIITQARMTSTRLPGKILMEANGLPLLKYHVDRLKQSSYPIFIATTGNKEDDAVVAFAKQEKIPFIRGSEPNVLSRYYNCAVENNLKTIIRVTSDCPLIDGQLIKNNVEKYLGLKNQNLYMSNAIKRTYPRGFDFEIFSFLLLEEAYNKATSDLDKEHVTPYINQNRSGNVEFYHVQQEIDKSNYRITVDVKEDFDLIKQLIENFQADKNNYKGIIDILDKHPELVLINAHVEQKKS